MRAIAGAVAFVLVCSVASAMPVGGLAHLPEPFSISLAIFGGYQQQSEKLIHDPDTQGSSYASHLSLNLGIYPVEFFGVFASIGTGDWRMGTIDYQSFLGVNYSGGVKFKVFPWERSPFQTVLSLGAWGFQASGTALEGDEEEVDVGIIEYQGSLVFSYAVERNILPFGGVRYVSSSTRFSPRARYNMAPVGKWGVQLGIDYFVTPYVFFSGEMQIFERTAAYLGVGLKY